jgi:hypothetical protein
MVKFHMDSDERYDLLLIKAQCEKYANHLEEILERQRNIEIANTDRPSEANSNQELDDLG